MFSYLESGSGLFEGITPDFGKDPASSAFALLIMRARAFVNAENFVPSAPSPKTGVCFNFKEPETSRKYDC